MGAAAPSLAKRRAAAAVPGQARLPADRDTFPKLLLHHAAERALRDGDVVEIVPTLSGG